MASAAKASQLATIACTMRGWGSPRPIRIRLRYDGLAQLREDIRRNLAVLIPRCEELDRTLPESMLRHHGYAASKVHHTFPLELGPAAEDASSPIPTLSEPAAWISRAAVPETDSIESFIAGGPPILAIGNVADTDLQQLLIS